MAAAAAAAAGTRRTRSSVWIVCWGSCTLSSRPMRHTFPLAPFLSRPPILSARLLHSFKSARILSFLWQVEALRSAYSCDVCCDPNATCHQARPLPAFLPYIFPSCAVSPRPRGEGFTVSPRPHAARPLASLSQVTTPPKTRLCPHFSITRPPLFNNNLTFSMIIPP